jgi:hypothetical protein
MLVKKLPLRELIPYTPQTRKNHPLYWCILNLKLWEYWANLYLYTVWTVNINTVGKYAFVRKWYVIGHCKCLFVFQHTNYVKMI